MRLVRPVASIALALSLFVTACGLDFDRFEPNDASSTDAPGSPGADASADAPLQEASSADAPFEASSGDAATGQDAPSQSDAPATGDSGPCGAQGQACCAGSTACEGGGCCSGGKCAAQGESPSNGNVCIDGTITACGGQAQPCCQDDGCSGKRCCVDGACIQMGQSCGAALGTCGNNSACATCGGDGQTCCTGAPGGQGVAANFCTTSGDACNPGTNKCTACGGSGPAVLRRGLVRRDRVLRPDREDVRRERGRLRRWPGDVQQRGMRGRCLRRHRRGVLRGRRRLHRAVLGVSGERVRRVRGHGRAVLPREQQRRHVVQRRAGVRQGKQHVRGVRGFRRRLLRGGRVPDGRLQPPGQVPLKG